VFSLLGLVKTARFTCYYPVAKNYSSAGSRHAHNHDRSQSRDDVAAAADDDGDELKWVILGVMTSLLRHSDDSDRRFLAGIDTRHASVSS